MSKTCPVVDKSRKITTGRIDLCDFDKETGSTLEESMLRGGNLDDLITALNALKTKILNSSNNPNVVIEIKENHYYCDCGGACTPDYYVEFERLETDEEMEDRIEHEEALVNEWHKKQEHKKIQNQKHIEALKKKQLSLVQNEIPSLKKKYNDLQKEIENLEQKINIKKPIKPIKPIEPPTRLYREDREYPEE